MKLPGYYSSGEFARMAGVSLRTIRYYDQQDILKPSFVSGSGARFYTDDDFARLQQIILLKYLGFTLEDIREITIRDIDCRSLLNSLKLQKKLVQDRIEQMQLVENAIDSTMQALEMNHEVNWSQMLSLIHLTGVEKSLKNQYQNATNIAARIRLHKEHSVNKTGWFPWIYDQCHIREGMNILELGCGDGTLWLENISRLPQNIQLTLSDLSDGMLRDVRRNIGQQDRRFFFAAFDCHEIPFPASCFDLVIANHLLFYCRDIGQVCSEVRRVLKPGGLFACSTYGSRHMHEISGLVQRFDSRIVLSADRLYERFGLDNGASLLSGCFSSIRCMQYDDSIELNDAEPLIEYILSCHGNQNQFLLNRFKDFRSFVEKQTQHGFHITKEAGIFLCQPLPYAP